MLTLDHLVFATDTLENGAEWMTEALGVAPSGGGVHPDMGTHNRLWRLGPLYMEVIAINPAVANPPRNRWFGLDHPAIQSRLGGAPKLLTWVAQVPSDRDLAALRSALPLDPGPVVRLTRDALWWDLTVRDDGLPVMSGVWPSLIRWPAGVTSPALGLPDSGVALKDFSYTGPAALAEAMTDLGASRLVRHAATTDTPTLAVTLRRADGQTVEF